MKNHTPGPWTAQIGGGGCKVEVNNTMLMPWTMSIPYDHLVNHPELVEEAQANAALIASAPSLLAQRDELMDALQDCIENLVAASVLSHPHAKLADIAAIACAALANSRKAGTP